jgi:hypothetical protein
VLQELKTVNNRTDNRYETVLCVPLIPGNIAVGKWTSITLPCNEGTGPLLGLQLGLSTHCDGKILVSCRWKKPIAVTLSTLQHSKCGSTITMCICAEGAPCPAHPLSLLKSMDSVVADIYSTAYVCTLPQRKRAILAASSECLTLPNMRYTVHLSHWMSHSL